MIVHTNLRGLGRLLRADAKRMEKAIRRATASTAKKAVKPIRKRVPKAFGELHDSVQGYSQGSHGGPVTSVDAPHAGGVEVGTLPHTPDFPALLAWVKLRGLQGLTKAGKLRRRRFAKSDGPTTPHQAHRVGRELLSLGIRGPRGGRNPNRARLIDQGAEEVARRIAQGIEKHGTKPHWYVRNSLPEIRVILDKEVRHELIERKQEAHASHAAFPLVIRK